MNFDVLKDDFSGWRDDEGHRIAAEEPRARRASALLYAAVALVYPAWHWISLAVMPDAYDPLRERLLISVIMIAAIGCFRVRRLRRHIRVVEHVLLFIMTAHFLSLVWRNGLAVPYMVGTFVVFASVSVVLSDLTITITYSLCSLCAGAAMVAFVARPVPLALEWLLGIATVLVAITIGTYRTSTIQAATMARVAEGRQLLNRIIEAIPDPVFVRKADRTLVLTNEAGRDMENATGYDLDPVAQCEEASLSSGQAQAADARIATNFGALTMSIKTAIARLPKQQTMLVTVMRDVTQSRALEESLRQKVRELEETRERVRQLEGILPICMHCSRIRVADARWEKIETYVAEHSRASFTHTLCSSCLAQHYPPEEST